MPTGPLLIVDDEAQNLGLLRQILEDTYTLVFAKSGEQAIEAALRHKPALVLLDINMPDMDGFAVCQALKADWRTSAIPVIFVTTLAETGSEEAGFEVGAVDYIVKPVVPGIVRARVKAQLSLVRVSELETSYREAISMLGDAGHYNDNDTGVHIWRMASYAKQLAKAVGWSAEDCRMMELAAPMHDTGKIGIPREILVKPGPLTEEQWRIMKTHCQIGYDILTKSHAPVFVMAADIALHHHEKWDGSGYPDALRGEAIAQSARIVALADVFDALSMKRPYKEAWPHDRVMETIRAGAGLHFDPELVEAFVSIESEILTIKAHWDETEAADNRPAP